MAFWRTFSTAMPAPSSETSMMTWLPSWHGAQLEHAFGILARGLAHVGRLDAVIERVAHRVRERVFDGLEQALVELRLLALHLQADAPAERLRKVADHARHLGEDVGDRLHARLHHRLAQVGRDHVEAAREHGHIGIGGSGLQNLVAGEHQFAHQIHHAVEQGDIDAQACFPRRLPAGAEPALWRHRRPGAGLAEGRWFCRQVQRRRRRDGDGSGTARSRTPALWRGYAAALPGFALRADLAAACAPGPAIPPAAR